MTNPPVVLLVTDPAMAAHAWPGHPERPERIGAAADGVAEGAEAAGARLVRRSAPPAPLPSLARVHDPGYLEWLEARAAEGGGWLDVDTYLAVGSPAAAYLAAGLSLAAATAAATGEAQVAFAVVRPPGHHARREGGAGFCLVNNVAVSVEELRAGGAVHRVAILDWDVHHGDGTQAIFEADPDVFYASTHQMPLYPGSGAAEEQGSGAGRGLTLNVPLLPGSGDQAFVAAWRESILPAVEAFDPDAILVSAGYDGHRDDSLASLTVTEDGYRSVAMTIGEMARRAGIDGVALTLEGGYDLAALRASTAATVEGLLAGLGPVPGRDGGT